MLDTHLAPSELRAGLGGLIPLGGKSFTPLRELVLQIFGFQRSWAPGGKDDSGSNLL